MDLTGYARILSAASRSPAGPGPSNFRETTPVQRNHGSFVLHSSPYSPGRLLPPFCVIESPALWVACGTGSGNLRVVIASERSLRHARTLRAVAISPFQIQAETASSSPRSPGRPSAGLGSRAARARRRATLQSQCHCEGAFFATSPHSPGPAIPPSERRTRLLRQSAARNDNRVGDCSAQARILRAARKLK